MGALRKLLVTYGEGLEGEAALKAGLGVDIDTLQADFDTLLNAKYGTIVKAMKPPKELEVGKGNPESVAAAFPDSFPAQVALRRVPLKSRAHRRGVQGARARRADGADGDGAAGARTR